MAVCIAVIAKENYPLYIRCVPVQNELKFHYTVHTSLDVVEEKISSAGKSIGDQRELYLGLLYPTEDYKMFRKLHNSFTDVMCNPFHIPGDTIKSKAFDSIVSGMMVQAG
ncbi:Trafficking protein particle complex subunit 2-like protein [Takifugu flavidus]|uniref:Trafficking protein particle complex subunit 2-like protein n=2 Tax=Takifugu TaxID=31032 RepID=A0A3B5KF07_TAKRU|nr:Trafficking protein particle complex subunit 2-like protein [Takifugu flavidus]